MLDALASVALFLPWWAWLLLSFASGVGFALGWATALASLSAYGSNYRVLSARQRRMGRGLALLSLLAVPVFAVAGIAGLVAAAWRLSN
ncbi:MAG: hypothetical protein ACK5VV_05035 [Lysobacteraceae bacterium]|jgi:hypothetical protein|nr:hypothetical protein [Xanthomonadaceae bacterium]MCZ8317608.1 hypothetical protein [Silanimonas sp.]